MSNIDKRALREAADSVLQKYGSEWFETGSQLCTVHKSKIELIAAANPATVLALLDELEAVQKTSAARLGAIDTTHKMFQRERDRAEAAENLATQQGNIAVALFDEVTTLRRNADDKAPELRSQLEEAERRIAELEARDKPKFVQCWSCKHDIEVLAIADCDGYCPRCSAPIDLDDEPYAAARKGEA